MRRSSCPPLIYDNHHNKSAHWPTVYWKSQTTHFLENQIKLFVVLEELHELNDVGVPLAMVESLHLTENPRSCMPRDLLDHLDGKLLIGEDVHARLNAGVCSFAQHLTGQFVQI